MRKIVIGLTGGIGTGKSTVAGFFKELGAEIVDCDKIAREVVAAGTEGDKVLRSFFPEAYNDEGGELDRNKLKQIIFSSDTARQKLDFIMHPLIYDRCEQIIGGIKGGIVVLEAALLFEAGFEELCNVTVCTFCSEREQIERVINRDNLSEELVKKMIASQAPGTEKVNAADIAINTRLSLDDLKKSVKKIYSELYGRLDRIV